MVTILSHDLKLNRILPCEGWVVPLLNSMAMPWNISINIRHFQELLLASHATIEFSLWEQNIVVPNVSGDIVTKSADFT